MEQINSIAQCLESKVNEQQNQEQNREYLSDALPKKRIRVNKRERKELKKQQNIKEGKINEKPSEIQHEPVLREMIALPSMKEETNGMTIMTYNVTYFSFISCVNCNFKATSIVNYISF